MSENLTKLKSYFEGFKYKEKLKVDFNNDAVIGIEVNLNGVYNFYDLIVFCRNKLQFKGIIYIVSPVYNIRGGTPERKIKYHNCVFKENVHFVRGNFNNLEFKNVVFEKRIDFKETKIEDCDFIETKFKKGCDFEKTVFQNVNFSKSEFMSDIHFNSTKLYLVVNLKSVIFHKQVQFYKLMISRNVYVNFENAEFKQGVDFSRSNLFEKNDDNFSLRLWGIKVNPIPKDFCLYSHDEILECDMKDDDGYIAMQRLRETYRFIKQFFKDKGNHIDALTFQQHEMFAYQKELSYTKAWDNKKEKAILHANRWSNGFGSSWTRGFWFTTVMTLITYFAFIWIYSDQLIFDFGNVPETLKYFFKFLNITDWDVKPFGIDESGVYLILFIGRVFIGYGFYQTIQAFRKYKSN